MKSQDLKAGTWYKFYSQPNSNWWHILVRKDGNGKDVSNYIGDFGDGRFFRGSGTFSEKNEYFPSLPEEINEFLPDNMKIIANYEIY